MGIVSLIGVDKEELHAYSDVDKAELVVRDSSFLF